MVCCMYSDWERRQNALRSSSVRLVLEAVHSAYATPRRSRDVDRMSTLWRHDSTVSVQPASDVIVSVYEPDHRRSVAVRAAANRHRLAVCSTQHRRGLSVLGLYVRQLDTPSTRLQLLAYRRCRTGLAVRTMWPSDVVCRRHLQVDNIDDSEDQQRNTSSPAGSHVTFPAGDTGRLVIITVHHRRRHEPSIRHKTHSRLHVHRSAFIIYHALSEMLYL